MYIDIVPNRGSPPAVLLREGWREGGKVRKRTIANLSDWPQQQVEALRRLLKGEPMVSAREAFYVHRSLPHGHVEAILEAIGRLGVDRLVASRQSRQRSLVLGMMVQRLIDPGSKLACIRSWHNTTLAEELKVQDADVDELYQALDWLLARQGRIEKKLAGRHLGEGAAALYDVTSSYYEGRCCALARRGHNRDGKKNTLSIVYGLLTDREGRPVGVQVYPGDTGDPTTVPDQVDKLRGSFGLRRIVLVGDRGMLTEARIEQLRAYPQLGWISALRSGAIRRLTDGGAIQPSLFDEQDLAEIVSPEFPGERLVVCFNPLLAEDRRRTRQELLEATEKQLQKVAAAVARRTRRPMSKDQIGLKVGKVIHGYKVAKHFRLTIEDGRLEWQRDETSIAAEAALDGIYVVRTSEAAEELPRDDVVRGYKLLGQVEHGFRTLKGLEIRVRPIFHRVDDRVRAHIFLCMLAYYVEWHLRRVWAPLLFDDEELPQDRQERHPVRPAKPSASAQRKKRTRQTAEGLEVQSFPTLLECLATRCRNTCSVRGVGNGEAPGQGKSTFECLTDPTPLQGKAFELVELLPGTAQ
jgi:transposase